MPIRYCRKGIEVSRQRTILAQVRPDHAAASGYFYIPFEVEPGTTRISIGFDFGAAERNFPDFGLTDPQLQPFPSATGIRGWSANSRRRQIFVATDDATPGYHYGPIPPGEWQFAIGLDKIPESGTEVTLNIELDDRSRPVSPQPVRSHSVRKGAGWYRGDLHCHTYHSDAKGSPETLHAAARQAGLDFLAVADHNTTTQRRYFHPKSSPDLVFVRGMEITTGLGHANVFGVDEIVDFRMNGPGDAHVLAADVRRRGGILSINHDKPTIPWQYEMPAADCMEVWQSTWFEWNWVSLERYQQRLAAGLRLSAIGGSDYHQPQELQPEGPFVLARPTTVFYLDELSEDQILKAMRAGHGYITEDPKGPHLAITANGQPMGSRIPAAEVVEAEVRGAAGDLLVWIDATGVLEEVTIGDDVWRTSLSAPGRAALFVRAEIVAKASHERLYAEVAHAITDDAPDGHLLKFEAPKQKFRRALSNPIYIGH